MIKRFQKIMQTGVFRKADGLGKFEFGKTTVFYGLNTFGKTTLKDIFNSLATNDRGHILKRKSIPTDAATQLEIILSCMDGSGEKAYKFVPTGWDCADLQGKIFVFDNDFIHRNLITGFEVTRDNKEALSDFILGEEGVKLSEDIRALKQKSQELKVTLKAPSYFTKLSGEGERKRFIQLNITESKDALSKLIDKKKLEAANCANQEQIKSLPNLAVPTFTLEIKIDDIVTKLNAEFARDFKEVTKETLEAINSHLTKCVTGSGAQGWIKQGLKCKKTDCCPFCGQTIAGAAESLIDAYNAYFNENYEKFAGEISKNLSTIEAAVEALSVLIHAGFLQLQVQLQKYKAFDPSIDADLNFDELQRLETSLNAQLTAWKKSVKAQIDKKNKEPHAALESISLNEELGVAITAFDADLKTQTGTVKTLIDQAKKLKDAHSKLTPAQVATAKSNAETIVKECEEKIARLDQDVDCKERARQQDSIQTIEREIAEKTKELETQQSGYISQYFNELNGIYKQLGSCDFELKSTTNNRGYKKIYELKITYKGVVVPHEDVTKFMSESDKRSLALAVFLTKLKHQPNKADLIIVLDDPVVSFDDNRISVSVDIIKRLSTEFKQIFVLTHYSSLVKKLLQTNTDGVYLEIVKNPDTSTFLPLKTNEFVLADHEIAFEKIYSFVAREHSNDITRDLRIYLEKYSQVRFHRKIKEFGINISSLKDFIDELKEKGVIKAEQQAELHRFRESLNPEHHGFIGISNEEDKRTYASNLIDYLSTL